MNNIRTIVIDDERSAREEVKRALKRYADFEVIGEAQHIDEARQLIGAKQPDVIFLDIHMPEGSGFNLLESLTEVPLVIFTTAFNQYAVQAFDNNALDYLMKPIRDERFAKAIEKVRAALNVASANNPQLFIKDGDKYHFVRLHDIYLIESRDNYSCLYFRGQKALLKRSLRQWEEMLDATVFFRISRTQLINKQYIKEVNTLANGRLTITLQTGECLAVSSRQSAKFKSGNGI